MAILQFINFVRVSPFADGKFWFLHEDLEYELLKTGIVITVPTGFVTDFASVPRPVWAVFPPWGKYGPPAVVHDFLYWDQSCSRKQADRIMALAMKESRVRHWNVHAFYMVLRAWGWIAWNKNAKDRAKGGLGRIPPEYMPKNPNVTWAEYEKELRDRGVKPDVWPNPNPPPAYCSEVDRFWT
jgi:hypothetical protein